MTVYDYMTPFESQNQMEEYPSPVAVLPKATMEEPAMTTSTSLDTPQPFTTKPLTSDPPSSYDRMLELSHSDANDYFFSDVCSASSPCRNFAIMQVASGPLPKHNCCDICADMAGKEEHADRSDPTELEKSRVRSRKSSDHLHTRHSLLHKCPSPVVHLDLQIPEEQSKYYKPAHSSLQDKCTLLERESSLLERESADLKYEASPLEEAAHPLETLDSAAAPCTTKTSKHLSQPKARQEGWKRQLRAQNAPTQLLAVNSGQSPAYSLQKYDYHNFVGETQQRLANPDFRTVPYYGKCL